MYEVPGRREGRTPNIDEKTFVVGEVVLVAASSLGSPVCDGFGDINHIPTILMDVPRPSVLRLGLMFMS